ncbi:MAG TPA: glycosyltransferase [Candidatus Sulfotelmatobacter sp.]|jgi:glycosyltransferase involved in cell wall biosynthesis|nr:glycosyltransferase [Candidatus Sulfotelmatobacter sp.]
MRPAISIIIPTLNEEQYIPGLLSDLVKQTEKNFEVIISDGNSSDNTRKVVDKFKKDLKISFYLSPKRHASYQRNFGASKAKSDYLFFLDADTRISTNIVEKAVTHIKKENYSLYLPVIESSNPRFRYSALVSIIVVTVRLLHKVGRPLSIGPIILIKKDLFDAIKGFDLHIIISEDHNLIIKAHKYGIKAHFLTDMSCVFSMRRLERDGMINVLWKYAWFTAETLIRGGVYGSTLKYEMGGQNYKQVQI